MFISFYLYIKKFITLTACIVIQSSRNIVTKLTLIGIKIKRISTSIHNIISCSLLALTIISELVFSLLYVH